MTGCATQTGLLSPDDLYPEALTVCKKEPAVPPRPAPGVPRSEEAKSDYVKELRGAWADCSDTVTGVKERKAAYKRQYDAERNPLTKLWPFGDKD